MAGRRLGRGRPNRPIILRTAAAGEAPPTPPNATTWTAGQLDSRWHTGKPRGRWDSETPRGRWRAGKPRGG